MWKSRWPSWATRSIIVLTVSVDVKRTLNLNSDTQSSGAVWKSRWPSWAHTVPNTSNSPYGLCGRKATLNLWKSRWPSPNSSYGLTELASVSELRGCVCESRGGRPGLPVPNTSNSLCGRKVTLNLLRRKSSGAEPVCEGRGGRPGLIPFLAVLTELCWQ